MNTTYDAFYNEGRTFPLKRVLNYGALKPEIVGTRDLLEHMT